jgi:protein-tyrosine phosphatase
MSVLDHTPQWLPLDGAVNARRVIPGVLLRADNLQSLSAEDVRRLVEEESLEVVLDLRTDTEVRSEGPGPITTEPAVRIEHRSLYPDSGGNTDLDAAVKPWGREDPQGLPEETPVVQAYVSYLQRRPDSVVGSVRTIARAEGAVLVHCAAGKDRTGTVVGLALKVVGVPDELVIADFAASAERVPAIMARLRTSTAYAANLQDKTVAQQSPTTDTMRLLLRALDERYGGVPGWLDAQGWTDADTERMRRKLLAD